jgi:hypothetical protein
LLGVIAHAVTLANGFVFDDLEAIRDNPVVQGTAPFRGLFTRDFWGRVPGSSGSVGTWRPLVEFTLWLDRRLGGGGPFAFHLSNLVFHAAAVTALTVALDRQLRDRRLAIATGSLFAAFAIGSEGVASIVARADTLAAAFGFLAFAMLPDRTRRVRARDAIPLTLAFLAALLCKEAAIATPAWILFAEFVLGRDVEPRARRSRFALVVVAALAAVALYLAVRLPLFGGAHTLGRSYNNNPLLAEGLGVRVLTALRLFGLSVQLTLLPLQLAPDYSFAEIMPSRSWLEPAVLVGTLVLASCVLFAVACVRRIPAVSVGVAMFVVPWFVVSNIVVPLPTIFAERLLYAPAAGIALLLALGIEGLRARDRGTLATALLVLLVAANGVRSLWRDLDWHDSRSLFSQAVIDTPRCARSWENLGAALMEARQPERARRALETAVRIAPQWAAPYALLGGVLDELGDAEAAEHALRRAVRLDPAIGTGYFNLTVFLLRHGRRADAIDIIDAALRARPNDARLLQLARELGRR